MAYSYIEYIADGSTTTFTIPFNYLNPDHIKVFVDGVDTTFSFNTAQMVSLAEPPGQGVTVRLARFTDIENRIVDFSDGAVLSEADLDASNQQTFYAAQEAIDSALEAVRVDVDGKIDAKNRIIKNVADPVDPQDAVTKAHLGYEYPKVQTVADNIAKVNTVSTSIAAVNTVSDNIANVNVVSGNNANVTKVANIDSKVTTVANNDTNVTTVANVINNVNTVAGNIANVNTVAGSQAKVNTVSDNIASVNAVANDIQKVITTANDLTEAISEIDTVANHIANVDTVGTHITNVDTVATSISNVNAVGTNIANVIGADANAANINAVVSNATNINTVSGSIANVNAVGNNIANVNAVHANAANINAVVGNETNINIVATNIGDINSAYSNAQTAIQAAAEAAADASRAELSANAMTSNTVIPAEYYYGDGVTTDFTIERSISYPGSILVEVAGVVQAPVEAYTTPNATTIRFSEPVLNGALISVRYLDKESQSGAALALEWANRPRNEFVTGSSEYSSKHYALNSADSAAASAVSAAEALASQNAAKVSEDNADDSEAQALQYRNEALSFRNEAEGFAAAAGGASNSTPTYYSGDGTTTDFTLTAAAQNNQSLMITINAVFQDMFDAYELVNSGATVRFTSAPPNGARIVVRYV